jgi:predicted DNA-binding transcriptional regulator AlpA
MTSLLRSEEADRYLGFPEGRLRMMRSAAGPKRGMIEPPCHVKLGKSVRYRIQDLDAWVEAHLVSAGGVGDE